MSKNTNDSEIKIKKYRETDIAIIIPTKDRPEKIKKLLSSITEQSNDCGRIIVIDGGEGVKDIVMSFADRLPVEHYECYPPGQIKQRNMAISLLDEETGLVAILDDDIVLQPGAISSMIDCWNRKESDTAGIGFNIINNGKENKTWWRKIFLMTSDTPGRVLISGSTSQTCPTDNDIRCQWLCGGATVWRLKVLQQHLHQEVRSRWAIGEDLIFSYPIGQYRPLYVCANACVRHEHVSDYDKHKPYRFHGISRALWMLYFVTSNKQLSLPAYLWMNLGSICGRLLGSIVLGKREHLEFAIGLIKGLRLGLMALIRGDSLLDVIEKETG